jgi:Na+/H+ antiporter NhaD/arsenite permease-like protein
MAVFVGIFLFFIGVTSITREYQSELNLRSSLMVAFFLGGLIVLGGLQQWWLEPLLAQMSSLTLFLGATGLTAITDNAALTYLGSQVSNPTFDYQYALVAGAVAGGGLTVIANAPNPAGYSILQDRFGEDGISALKLFLYALVPTLIAMACLWLTPR